MNMVLRRDHGNRQSVLCVLNPLDAEETSSGADPEGF